MSGSREMASLPRALTEPRRSPRLSRFAVCGLVFLLGAATGAGVVAAAGPAPRQTARVLLDLVTHDLGPKPTRVHVNVDRWDPAAESGEHRHPGPTILYVLEGEVTAVTADGEKTYRVGDVMWHPGRRAHNMKNQTAHPARALAVHIDPL